MQKMWYERGVFQPIILPNLLGLIETQDHIELTGLGEDRDNRTLILRGVHDDVQVQQVDPAIRMDMSFFSKLQVNEKQTKVKLLILIMLTILSKMRPYLPLFGNFY